jgi:hypothetical protein
VGRQSVSRRKSAGPDWNSEIPEADLALGLLARNDFPFARYSGVFMAISSWRNSEPHDELTVLSIQENFMRISLVIKDGT